MKELRQDVIDFISSRTTLDQQAGLSLDERTAIVRREFHLLGFNTYHLRSVYRRKGVSMKRIKLAKVVTGAKLNDQSE